MQEVAIKYFINIILSTQMVHNQLAHIITSFLLEETCPALEIGNWINNNFVVLTDYMSNLVTTVSGRQAVDLRLHRLSSHHYKQND